jgi:prophage antirepressor-like protein
MVVRKMELVKREQVLGREFKIYGSIENPLFLAKDVAEWIEYNQTKEGWYDVSAMLRTIDDNEKQKIRTTINNPSGSDLWFLTEDGLYEVLMQSRKPIAKEFKAQVKAILKEIRKTGGVVVRANDFVENWLPDLDEASKIAIAQMIEANKKLRLEIKEQQAKLLKSEKTNAILMHTNKTYTMTEIAKELNIKSATELNQILKDKGIQYNVNKTWVMYSDYANKGYTEIKQIILENGKEIYDRKITQRGREFILSLFENELFEIPAQV